MAINLTKEEKKQNINLGWEKVKRPSPQQKIYNPPCFLTTLSPNHFWKVLELFRKETFLLKGNSADFAHQSLGEYYIKKLYKAFCEGAAQSVSWGCVRLYVCSAHFHTFKTVIAKSVENFNALELIASYLLPIWRCGVKRWTHPEWLISAFILCQWTERVRATKQSFPWMAEMDRRVYLQQRSRCLCLGDSCVWHPYQNPNMTQPEPNYSGVCQSIIVVATRNKIPTVYL